MRTERCIKAAGYIFVGGTTKVLMKSKRGCESEETHVLRQRLTTAFQPKWRPNKTSDLQAVVRS
jgi:hypothetical protein